MAQSLFRIEELHVCNTSGRGSNVVLLSGEMVGYPAQTIVLRAPALV